MNRQYFYSGDADLASVNLGSPFYTGHCLDDSMHITSPGHASPPEICGLNTGQHMFIPMSDQCVMINLNIGTSAATRSWNIKVEPGGAFTLFLLSNSFSVCSKVESSLLVQIRITIYNLPYLRRSSTRQETRWPPRVTACSTTAPPRAPLPASAGT